MLKALSKTVSIPISGTCLQFLGPQIYGDFFRINQFRCFFCFFIFYH